MSKPRPIRNLTLATSKSQDLEHSDLTRGDFAAMMDIRGVISDSCVLVVEDDPLVRMVIARALESAGYAVLGAGNGLDALECLEHSGSDIHLVLTDIRMPRLGGLELGREIAARQWSIPVVYMSGDPPDALRGNAGAGRSPCLQKPFSMAALLATVHELLEANGARR